MAKYTLTSYDPIEVEIPRRQIPEEYIAAKIDERLEPAAQYVPLEKPRPVAMYDFLAVTTENAALDGNPAAFLNMEHSFYAVGSGEMPREFDAAIIGARIGDTREVGFSVNSALGESGRSRMTLTVHIEQIFTREMPLLTDELVARYLAPLETVDDLRTSISEQFLRESAQMGAGRFANAVLRKAGERLVGDPDPADSMEGMTEPDLRETCAIDAFADYFDFELDIDEATEYLPGETPVQKLRIRKQLEEDGQVDELMKYAYRAATLRRLTDEAKITLV